MEQFCFKNHINQSCQSPTKIKEQRHKGSQLCTIFQTYFFQANIRFANIWQNIGFGHNYQFMQMTYIPLLLGHLLIQWIVFLLFDHQMCFFHCCKSWTGFVTMAIVKSSAVNRLFEISTLISNCLIVCIVLSNKHRQGFAKSDPITTFCDNLLLFKGLDAIFENSKQLAPALSSH